MKEIYYPLFIKNVLQWLRRCGIIPMEGYPPPERMDFFMELAINIELRIKNQAYDIITDPRRSEGARYNDCRAFLQQKKHEGWITERELHIFMSDALKVAEEVAV